MTYLWIIVANTFLSDTTPISLLINMVSQKIPMFETRMEVLEKTINKHIDRIENNENQDLMEIYHLFYDEN